MALSEEELIAFERRVETMYEAGQLEELWREVNAPSFLADALANRAVTAQALRVLAAMVWHTPDAIRVFEWLRSRGATRGLETLAREVDEESALAVRMFRIRNAGIAVPDTLVRVLARHSLVMSAARQRAWADLARAYGEPLLLLGHCERIAERDQDLARALITRLRDEVPRDRASLADLDRGIAAALASALDAIPRRGFARRVLDILGDAAQVARTNRRYEPFRPRTYQGHVRPAIARVLFEVGVPLTVAIEAIAAGAVRRLDHRVAFAGDLGLHVFGVLVTIMHAARAAPPDELASPYR